MGTARVRTPSTRTAFTVVVTITLIYYILATRYRHAAQSYSNTQFRRQLLHLRLSDTFQYTRTCIDPQPNPYVVRERGSVFKHDGGLVSKPKIYSAPALLFDGYMGDLDCAEALTLHVPQTPSSRVDPSRLILGSVTTLGRLTASLPEWAAYLAGSGTRIAVMLRDQHDPDAPAVQRARDLARSLNIDLRIVCEAELLPSDAESPSHFREGSSNLEIALALVKHKKSHTQWYGIVDDDTFINSIPDLLRALDEYDPTQSHYIGALTETTWKADLDKDLPFAYGGAGFFLSAPVMEKLAASFSSCLRMPDLGLTIFGDKFWASCIDMAASINLTQAEGLHQLDFVGSLAGWYESGMWPLLTVHHWKSWHRVPVPACHMVTVATGTDSFLARYSFEQQNIVLTTGYSIVHYPNGIPDLNKTEQTWDPSPDVPAGVVEVWPQLGPLRTAMSSADKESWLLEHSVQEGKLVRQWYVRRGEIDSVREIAWNIA